MRRSIPFGIAIILALTLSCARGVSNLEMGMRVSDNLYNDLAPQVAYVLQSPSTDHVRMSRLRLTNEKLNEYRKAYNECIMALSLWKSTGQPPENIMDLYAGMWRSLLEAQTLAANAYIYTSECVANTTLKGKACKN